MGRRREEVQRAEPGAGTVQVQIPIARMLAEHGCTPTRLTGLVRGGCLRCLDRTHDWHPFRIKAPSEGRVGRYPFNRDFPVTKGCLTWRRRDRTWSLDIESCEMGDALMYHGALGNGEAKLTIRDATLPDTAITALAGMPISRIATHRWFDDPALIVRRVTVYPRTEGVGRVTPPSVEIVFACPVETHPDSAALYQ